MLRFSRAVVAVVGLALAFQATSFSQSIQGSITGIVRDPQGAVVVGAKVIATEVSTNISRAQTTNGSGLYSIHDLPPGTYAVTVSAPGFRPLKSGKIVLVAASTSRFDADLLIGNPNAEVVEVKERASTLVTDSGETGNVQTGQDLVRQPMQRSLLQVLRLDSGTVSGDSSSVMIGGQRNQYENLTIDGITTTNNIFGGQSGAMTADQSYESVAEVKIIDGNGSADNPGFTSLITTTKGGGNQLHGSAFYTTDNSAFDSIGFGRTSKLKGPRLQWYGGSVGGPVVLPKLYDGHNKTFFFATWEHRTFPIAAGNATDFSANLPNAAFGQGDFSSLLPGIQLIDPYNGNPIPNNQFANDPSLSISAVALALQNNFYPTLPSGTSYNQDFSASGSSPEHINRYDIRIDHRFSGLDTLSARFTRQKDVSTNNYDGDTPVFFHDNLPSQNNMYLAEVHSFSTNLLNEIRLGYSRDHRQYRPNFDGNKVLQQIGLNLGVLVPAGVPGSPLISFGPSNISGLGNTVPAADQLGQEYSLLDNVTWQKGNHSIKTGVLLRYGRPQNTKGNFAPQFGNFSFNGFATGFDYADFLLGIPSQESLNNDVPDEYVRKTDTGLFVQDSWHVTPKLTLNYGARWEYYMPPVDLNDRRASFDPATGNVVVPDKKTLGFLNPALPPAVTANIEMAPSGFPGRSLLYGRKTNFGPRFGFAYMLGKGTVIRGGYGIYHSYMIAAVQASLEGGEANSGLFGIQSGDLVNTIVGGVPQMQFPNPFANQNFALQSNCTSSCLSISGTDPHIKAPTEQQWNLTVEHDLGHSLVARASYRGFMTTQLPFTNDLNIPRIFGGAPAYPLFSHVLWTASGGIQKMNALDATLERKFTGGLTFQTAYTLQKNLSDDLAGDGGSNEGDSPSNPYDRAADMGNVYYTPRHRLVNNVVWDIPVGRRKRFFSSMPKALDAIVGGWEIAGINTVQSGYFLTPTEDFSAAGPNSTATPLQNNGSPLRPDCNGSLSVYGSWNHWFNTGAITQPAQGTYGNCRVGSIQGPHQWGFNFAFYKYFKLGERFRLRFDGNMVNAFNHPAINNPDTNLGNADTPGGSSGSNINTAFGTIGQSSSPYVSGGDSNLLNSSVSRSSRGARHIWLGMRLEF